MTQNSIHYLRPADTLQNGATAMQMRRIVEYSRCFIWSFCIKKYSDDVFHTCLGLDSVIYSAVNGAVPSLPVFIQNILNCDKQSF